MNMHINEIVFNLSEYAQVTSGTLGLSTATVKLITADNEEKIACSVGNGPVDAAYKAVDSIVQVMLQNLSLLSVL